MPASNAALPPEIADYKLDESIGYLMARAKSAMSNTVTQHTMTELGITSTQASILFMLATGRCTAAVDLARDYGIDASAVTRLIDRLEKRGLLYRSRSQEDRRVVKLELTDEGYALAAKMPALFRQAIETMTTGFSVDELDTLRTLLRRMLLNAGISCKSSPPAE
jgi:DNA-binding MarR family transcriptional regulator